MRRAIVVLTCFCFIALSGLAPAHEQARLDADDTDGPFDAVVATLRHPKGPPERVRFRLTTYGKWGLGKLYSQGRSFITFELDLDQDDHMERCIVVDATKPAENADLELQAHLYAGCNYFSDNRLATLPTVGRPDRHSVKVSGLRNVILGASVTGFRWRAVTAFETIDHPKCPTPDPHGDGGYAACTDRTRWKTHP